jgi:hypothetical protein
MGIRSYTYVAINDPKINAPAAVSNALEPFDLCRLRLEIAETGDGAKLKMEDDFDPEDADWPSVVRTAELPDQDDAFASDDESRLHDERGQQGLMDLLLALAPYLAEPLILQAASFDSTGEFYSTAEWTVQPGTTSVEFKEIAALGRK